MTGLKLGVDINTSGNTCPQCGLIHPPLPTGERCPNAKPKVEGLREDDVRIFAGNLQNMILYHIETKKASNPKKIFQDITLMVAKYLEEIK